MKKRIISLALVVAMLLCVLPAASAADANPKFSTYYLSLSESIAINFKVTGWTEDFAVTFTKGSEAPVTGVPKVLGDGVAVYTFYDLSPAELAVNITAKLTCGNVDQTITKSVRDYCNAILEGNYSINMKSLTAELVKFGSAFHTWKNDSSIPAINAPASTGVYASDADITLTDHEPKDATILSGVSLNDSVVPYYMLTGAASMKARFEGRDYPLVKEGEKFYFLELDPSDMRKEFTVTAYDENDQVLSTLNTSIESYAWYCNDANNTEAAVTKAMMKYGDAAAAYVASGNNTVDATGEVVYENGFNDLENGVLTLTQPDTKVFNFNSYNGKVAVEYKTKVVTGLNNFDPCILVRGASTFAKIIFKNGAVGLGYGLSTSGTYTNDKWYTVKIVADPDTQIFEVYLDGTMITENRSYNNEEDIIKALYFQVGTGTGTVYYDDVKVTKFGG